MAISSNNYVSITSGVGGGAGVGVRDLIARIFTTNGLVPTGSFIEFTSAADVGTYFGTTSEEYARALFYFGWISKNITTPDKISFARWVNADVAPEIFGNPSNQVLGTYTGISNGAISLTLDGVTHILTGMDFTAAGSLADVAAVIQTEIRTQTGAIWTGATVSFDATRKSFNFVGGATGVANVAVALAGSGTEIAPLIGWLTGAILSDGDVTETITQTLTNSASASNNFGSFVFTTEAGLDLSQIVEAATWNNAQNVLYQFCVAVNASNASATSAALFNIGGTDITLSPLSDEYPEMVPMLILAATDYTGLNSTQNYMFQIFDLTPSVTDDADYTLYNNLRVNFYGQTQSAGQLINFYQRGVMTGLATDPVDMNVYANEQWLKDANAAALLTLLLALAKLSANVQGRSQVLSTLLPVIQQGLRNGTISVGKPLNSVQQLFITNATGDNKAWYQVQNTGWWLDVAISSFITEDNRTEWKAVYTLIYSKDDIIRKIEGTHVLI